MATSTIFAGQSGKVRLVTTGSKAKVTILTTGKAKTVSIGQPRLVA